MSLFFGFVTVGLISFICFDLQKADKLFAQLGSLIAMAVSLFLSLAIEEYLHRKLFSETFESSKKDKRIWGWRNKKSIDKENSDENDN